MKKSFLRVVSLLLIPAFFFQDLAFARVISQKEDLDKLATPSMFDDLRGIEFQDIGRLKAMLTIRLLEAARGEEVIDTDTLAKMPVQDTDSVYKTQFYFFERKQLSGQYWRVKCRTRDQKYGMRAYYAVFSAKREEGWFPIEIYTEKEWQSKGIETGIVETNLVPKRKSEKPKDAKAIDRYIVHESLIDNYIRKHIIAGEFAVIAGRDTELGWDKEGIYPDRVKALFYWSVSLLDGARSELDPSLALLGTSVDKALNGKDVVFIKVKRGTRLVITENSMKSYVRSHMSANALYIFVDEDLWGNYEAINQAVSLSVGFLADGERKIFDDLVRLLSKCLTHEIGVSYGLTSRWSVERSFAEGPTGRAFVNDLSAAFTTPPFTHNAAEIRAEFHEVAKLSGEPADLNLNLPTRDYTYARASASGDMRKDETGQVTPETIAKEIEAAWTPIGNQDFDPFGQEAQAVFAEIMRVERVRCQHDKGAAPHIFKLICQARLFGERDYDWVIRFFEFVKEMGADMDDFRRAVLYDREFLNLYFIALFMDRGSMRKAVDAGKPFFLFYMENLFGPDFNTQTIYPDPDAIANLGSTLVGSAFAFIDLHRARGECDKALEMLDNMITYVQNERKLDPETARHTPDPTDDLLMVRQEITSERDTPTPPDKEETRASASGVSSRSAKFNEELDRVTDYLKRLLPGDEGRDLTREDVKANLIRTNADDPRRLYTRDGRERMLPATFLFKGEIFKGYGGKRRPRFIAVTSYPDEKGVAITSIFSETEKVRYILAKGGCRWYQVGAKTGESTISTLLEKFLGNRKKSQDPLLPEGVRLGEAMLNKSPFWESWFDGGKTIFLANEGVDKEEFVRDWVASSILAGVLMKLYLAGPDTAMEAKEMGWIEAEKREAMKQFGMPPTNILATTSRDHRIFGTFPHKEWMATSIGVVETLVTALGNAELMKAFKIDPNNLTMAIVGFGDVGGGILKYLHDFHPDTFRQIKITTVSDSKGVIYNKDGLDKEQLIRLIKVRDKVGSDFALRKYYKGKCVRTKKTRPAYFKGADILIPAARGTIVYTEDDIKKMARAGTKLIVEGANNFAAVGVMNKFEPNGIIYFHGPVANGGGIYFSKEEVFHALMEGEKSIRAHMDERRLHVQGDVMDTAIGNAKWLADQLAQRKLAGRPGASIYQIHQEVVNEIISERSRLLDKPLPDEKRELKKRIDNDFRRIGKDFVRSEHLRREARRVLRIVNATELARERVMGRHIYTRAGDLLRDLNSTNLSTQRAAVYWAGKLRKREADVKLRAILGRQGNTALRRLAAISLAYINGPGVSEFLKSIRVAGDIRTGVDWALNYLERPAARRSASGEGRTQAVDRMVKFDKVFSKDREKEKLLRIYNRMVTKVNDICLSLDRKHGNNAVVVQAIGIISNGKAGNMVLATAEDAAVVSGPREVRIKVGIYDSFIRGICARLCEGDGELTPAQNEVVDALIEASLLRELGHGFEGYARFDMDGFLKDEDAVVTLLDISAVPPDDGVLVAEAVADLHIGGKDNSNYVRNKAAWLFYRLFSSVAGSYVTKNGIVKEKEIKEDVRRYHDTNQYLLRAMPKNSFGGEPDKVIEALAAQAVEYFKRFFGEGSSWHSAKFGRETTTMSPEDAAIAGYIKVIISKSSGEEERRGARQALGQYGQRAVLAVSAAMSALNKDGEDYRRLNATLKIIRARLSRTSASGADVKTLSPDEGVVMEVIARVKDLQTARFTASDFLEACKDDDVADLASRFSLSRDQATGILHSLAEKGVLDIIDLPNRSRQFKLTEDARIGIMARSANEVGLQIPTHSDERYTLIVNNDLYKNRELEADVKGYQLYGRHVGAGDRFGLMACDTSKVNNILSKVSDAARTVVQVAEGFSEADAAELMRRAPGIRIMRIDTAGFKYDQALDNESRRNCRFNLYAMMLAARKITKEDVLQNSAAYRLLSFFVNTHFKDGAEDIAESYIDALINSDKIAFIINHNLSYKPAKRWRRPTYSTVAAALISA